MSIDFAELRARMVDSQLRTTDVTEPAILDAMGALPRELFVDEKRRSLAYLDEDLQIAPGRYLMEPSPLAKLLQLAGILSTDRVLDVGTGTGYSAAVLSRLAASVVALESDQSLAASAREALSRTGAANVEVVVGPLASGHAAGAPYDVIVLQGAVDTLPDSLTAQLGNGGRLVAVEGRGNAGIAKVYLNSGGVITGRRAFNAALKPLSGFERTPAFEF